MNQTRAVRSRYSKQLHSAASTIVMSLSFGFALLVSGCGESKTSSSAEVSHKALDKIVALDPATLYVSAPDGGESYSHKSKIPIRWNPGNGGEKIKIELLKGGSVVKTIKKRYKNSKGSYSWKIPSCKKFSSGSDYKIRLTSLENGSITDSSDSSFTIGSASQSVTMTSPAGGASYNPKQRINISWSAPGVCAKVKIELLKGGAVVKTIKKRYKNKGRIRWKIPKKMASGSDYQVRVSAVGNSSVSDTSAYFAIGTAYINVSDVAGDGGAVIDENVDNGYSQATYTSVYMLNAKENGGKIIRWPSKSIGISGATDANKIDGTRVWKNFAFNFSGNDIQFKGDSRAANACGWAWVGWYDNGEMLPCEIYLHADYAYNGACGSVQSTIAHEVGHCLGVLNHTEGGLMNAYSTPSVDTTEPQQMLDALYSLPIGTRVTSAGEVSLGKVPEERGGVTRVLILGENPWQK